MLLQQFVFVCASDLTPKNLFVLFGERGQKKKKKRFPPILKKEKEKKAIDLCENDFLINVSHSQT